MKRLLFVFAIFHCASCNMTVTPPNTVVLAGDRVELVCEVDGNSSVYKWEMSKPLTKFKVETIVRFDKNSGSEVTNSSHLGAEVDSTGSGFIYYNSTDLDDAGNYTCWALGSDKRRMFYSAQLIVLESLPNCTSNYSSNSSKYHGAIRMQCSVNFRGFWAPTMRWIQHGGDVIANGTGQDVVLEVENKTVQNSHVVSSLTVTRDSLNVGTYFTCNIYFERTFDGILVMNATNIPDFVYIWNSSVYSKPSLSLQTMPQEERQQINPLYVLLISICVVVSLLAVAVIAASVWKIKKRNRARRSSCTENQEGRRGTCSSTLPSYTNGSISPYAHQISLDESPECRIYADLDETQISPVDLPPETRPRLNAIPDYSTTFIPQMDESSPSVFYSIQDSSKLEPLPGHFVVDPLDTTTEVISHTKKDLMTAEAALSPIYHTLDPPQAGHHPVVVESSKSATE